MHIHIPIKNNVCLLQSIQMDSGAKLASYTRGTSYKLARSCSWPRPYSQPHILPSFYKLQHCVSRHFFLLANPGLPQIL